MAELCHDTSWFSIRHHVRAPIGARASYASFAPTAAQWSLSVWIRASETTKTGRSFVPQSLQNQGVRPIPNVITLCANVRARPDMCRLRMTKGSDQMSELSGSLEDFPLTDVLRLLSRGTKHGVLHVYGDVVRGRVYLDEGKISYATTRSTDDFAEGSGAENRKDEDRRQLKLDEVGDEDPELFSDFLKLQITEVLVRLGRETSGSFVFQNGVTPQEAVKEPFTVDEILDGAEAELKEWHRIETIIGTTSQPMTIVLPVDEERSITLSGIEWNTLGILALTATTREVAERQQIFEIVAGRIIARLVEEGLVEVAMDPKAAGSTDHATAETPGEESESGEEAASPVDDDTAAQALSERETREVLSALSRRDETLSGDGFEGLGDDDPTNASDDDQDEAAIESNEDDEPPASELARRWRNLRAAAADQ